jgi:hypothetical protein
MSNYLPAKSVFDSLPFFHGESALPFAGDSAASRAAEERLVDSALRNVQLPEGLLTRLGKLVYSMPDESVDQVDWLGC